MPVKISDTIAEEAIATLRALSCKETAAAETDLRRERAATSLLRLYQNARALRTQPPGAGRLCSGHPASQLRSPATRDHDGGRPVRVAGAAGGRLPRQTALIRGDSAGIRPSRACACACAREIHRRAKGGPYSPPPSSACGIPHPRSDAPLRRGWIPLKNTPWFSERGLS